MSSFHLRPVSDHSDSPSPTSSATPPSERIPSFSKGLGQAAAALPSPSPSASTSSISSRQPRRPLSPSNIRDVDLSPDTEMAPRKYPAPPTGHDLMALFPPAPPEACAELRGGPTSGYFQHQERAFFAQAGKEIVRARSEFDAPNDVDMENSKGRSSRAWPPSHTPQLPPHLSRQSPAQTSANPPGSYPLPSSRNTRTVPVPGSQTPQFSATGPHSQPHPGLNLHPIHQQQPHPVPVLRTLPHDPSQPEPPMNNNSGGKVEFQAEEYRDPDEAWRRPIPYAERRRAGKHTRRVIVRN